MRVKYLLILPLVVVLYGCSADWHLRKAISKKPSILTEGVTVIEERDTVQILTERLVHDTIFDFTTDTVIVEKGKGKATVAVDTVMKKIYVEVQCDSDTVYVETMVRKTTIQPKVKDKGFDWELIGFIVLGLSFIFIIFRTG
ncbi:MAG: hypothetical protein Unbinned1473contig1000_59 [Prokaryotic dsDNA virus sp.]|nr:MAG: hypothetical protein Unbinned1473contig1000_59 [Prokaryotic dsDNA virus sp.]|tara:strand:- start:4486 stop:4911 length:426 start_codon:yes stop_codon:yes gene_type:complete